MRPGLRAAGQGVDREQRSWRSLDHSGYEKVELEGSAEDPEQERPGGRA